ncbi:Leucine aminopeptidase [Cladobotryum mycophilum]|uniref:Peptide hydrolase n=1 Tax=Cladobotryum mycophilum TaxID=491253 RepID=A0ABR0SC41_9HYPO
MKILPLLLCIGTFFTLGLCKPQQLAMDFIEADILSEQFRETLGDLENIANKNGGDRAFGNPGYKASVDYILERLKKHGDKLQTHLQNFTHIYETTKNISLTGPNGKPVHVVTLQYNTPTPLPGGITAQLVSLPVDDTTGSGCYDAQWRGSDVKGKIVLVKRGVCTISEKVRLAKKNGAVAVLIIHDDKENDIGLASLSHQNLGTLIPTGIVRRKEGLHWKKLLDRGDKLNATFIVDTMSEQRESWNIISETTEGDPNHVVMLGAHLDSIQGSPGINDNGSGCAGILQIANFFAKSTNYTNKARFAWWGAQESGLAGSLHYAKGLSEQDADHIRFYLNMDMTGSRHANFYIHAGDEADLKGATIIKHYTWDNGNGGKYIPFKGSSDYVPFVNLGIPTSGIFTGNSRYEHWCYHKKCDNYKSLAWRAVTTSAKAVGTTATMFALSLEGVPPRKKIKIETLVARSKREY